MLIASPTCFLTDIVLPNAPPVYKTARHAMAVLALGDAAQPPAFYEPFTKATSVPNTSRSTGDEAVNISSVSVLQGTDTTTELADHVRPLVASATAAVPSDIGCMMDAAFIQMKSMHDQFGSSTSGWSRVLRRLGNVHTATQWESLLHTFGSAVPLRRHPRAAIRVQPTAISRRIPGVSRGSKRRACGRPASADAPRHKAKRPRNLGYNVLQNQPNAKSHGEGH